MNLKAATQVTLIVLVNLFIWGTVIIFAVKAV